jgi:hypothetical protein
MKSRISWSVRTLSPGVNSARQIFASGSAVPKSRAIRTPTVSALRSRTSDR